MSELHVIFGVRGAIGMTIARQLDEAGIRVRAVLDDDGRELALPAHAEVVRANPIHHRKAIAAAAGAAVVYLCVDTRLRHWYELWLSITENVIAAAHAAEARLVVPGTVYVYGPLQQQPAAEDHPLAASGEKGRLRAAAQEALQRAHDAGQVSVVIPRFPEIYGPLVLNRFYGQIFLHALRNEATDWLGRLDNLRDLLYAEDAARACILLGQRPAAFGQVWHVPGPRPLTSDEFIRLVYAAAGHRPKVHHLSTLAMDLEGMFNPEMHAFREFHYLFEGSQLLDGSKFAAAFPDFVYTPHEEAVKSTLEWFRLHYESKSLPL